MIIILCIIVVTSTTSTEKLGGQRPGVSRGSAGQQQWSYPPQLTPHQAHIPSSTGASGESSGKVVVVLIFRR